MGLANAASSVPLMRKRSTAEIVATPRNTVGLSWIAKLMLLRRTPGKSSGGGIGTPKLSTPPALLNPPSQNAMPFWDGGGVRMKPAPGSPLGPLPSVTFAVACQ